MRKNIISLYLWYWGERKNMTNTNKDRGKNHLYLHIATSSDGLHCNNRTANTLHISQWLHLECLTLQAYLANFFVCMYVFSSIGQALHRTTRVYYIKHTVRGRTAPMQETSLLSRLEAKLLQMVYKIFFHLRSFKLPARHVVKDSMTHWAVKTEFSSLQTSQLEVIMSNQQCQRWITWLWKFTLHMCWIQGFRWFILDTNIPVSCYPNLQFPGHLYCWDTVFSLTHVNRFHNKRTGAVAD